MPAIAEMSTVFFLVQRTSSRFRAFSFFFSSLRSLRSVRARARTGPTPAARSPSG